VIGPALQDSLIEKWWPIIKAANIREGVTVFDAMAQALAR
jgi:hypothetical protein